jgi:hypothetical protein
LWYPVSGSPSRRTQPKPTLLSALEALYLFGSVMEKHQKIKIKIFLISKEITRREKKNLGGEG